MQICRLIAVKQLTMNRMSVFMQMGLVLQIAIDILLLGKTFERVQFIGFGMFLLLYTVLFANVCFEQSKSQKAQDVAF
jgi:drug/metabolite transporter (DMT)-like permease